MLSKNLFKALPLVAILAACQSNQADISDITDKVPQTDTVAKTDSTEAFQFQVDQFTDLRVLRYKVDGFDQLTLQQKTLLYYLTEAALSGRDIIWDQHYKYNLTIRKTLENIVETYKGNKSAPEYLKFMEYTKAVWLHNGIHHHYSQDKIMPEFPKEYLATLVGGSVNNGFPYNANENELQFIDRLTTLMFDPKVAPKRFTLEANVDIIKNSYVNFYEGVTQKEAEAFYKDVNKNDPKAPVMAGLNSKLVKENGKLVEKTWKLGGMYTQAIAKIIFWLEKAVTVAENPEQKDALVKLIAFYKSGSLKDFDAYNIAWVNDTQSAIDVVNGFIEVYSDPIGLKGDFESVVSVKDMEASKRIKTIGANAQWFEDNSPIAANHKKSNVTGISAKVINVVVQAGDAAPFSSIGINLPNNEWIRDSIGSKSVNLGNIVEAYDMAAGPGVVSEFYINKEIQERVKNYAPLADKLHTDMHEVIGHASGQLEAGTDQASLKNYASTLEEARADLVALYYIYDQKLVDLGVMPSLDYGKAAYDEYLTKGLIVQLTRLKPGMNLEEAHMRNRHLIASWVFEKGQKEKVVSKVKENNKTYFVVNDYKKLRVLFGELLKEIQRIKSQGDFKAGKALVENYGVKVDKALHKEVLDRYATLKLAPYAGFIQPKLVPVMEGGKIIDVKIEYPKDFTEQMMYYGKNYGFLPVVN